MPDVNSLRAAGFSDEEVGAWAEKERATLSGAGFSDQEINDHLAGQKTGQLQPSKGLINRFMEGNAVGRVISKIGEGYTAGFGQEDLGMSAKSNEWLREVGIYNNPENNRPTDNLVRGIRFANEAVINPVTKLGDAIFRLPNAVFTAIGGGAGQTAEEAGAAPGDAARLARDVTSIGNIGFILAGTQAPSNMTRVTRGPKGEVYDQHIGGLPREEHFPAAAETIATASPDSTVTVRPNGAAPAPGFDVYHSSPHTFDRFDLGKIGTGEGAQTYGRGLYFAENEKVADSYRTQFAVRGKPQETTTFEIAREWVRDNGGDRTKAEAAYRTFAADARLSSDVIERTAESIRDQNPGANLYKARISADKGMFLDWDKSFVEQDPRVQQSIRKILENSPEKAWVESKGLENLTGEQIHDVLARTDRSFKDDQAAAKTLRDARIPGIKYLDSGSRHGGGTRNYVLFDDKLVDVQEINGKHVDAVQAKLRTLYEEHGIHPAEVAHDAAADPIIKQELLSSTDKLPDAYTGGSGKPPAEPPKPPPSEPGDYSSALNDVLSKINVGGRDDTAMKRPFRKLYTETVDAMNPIYHAVKDAAGTSLPVAEDAYKLARLTKGIFGKADHFLKHGTFDFETYKNNGPALEKILEPVRDDLNGLRGYIASKRASEIEASGRESGIPMESAKTVIAESEKKYGPVLDQLQTYQNNLSKYLRDAGVISKDGYEAMVEANKNYVPFYRVMRTLIDTRKSGKSFSPSNPLKGLKGSDLEIVDPIESILKNTYAYISIAERNAVSGKLIDTLRSAGSDIIKEAKPEKSAVGAQVKEYLEGHGIKDADELTEIVKSAMPDKEGELSTLRNGKRETYTVSDPELLNAMRGLNEDSVNALTKLLAIPAKTLRAGITLTPEFMARNLTRDFLTAFTQSKGIFTPADTISGLKSAITKDQSYQTWLKSGGANAAMVSLDRRYMQDNLKALTETGLMDRAWNVVKSPLDGLRVISELAENATRLGEFKKDLGKATSKEAIQEAGFASREITTDFARIGASMRAYNMITAFANPNIQGTDRLARAFAERPVATTLKVAVGVTLPSVLLWYANHDDPRYQNLPDWQKDLFWIVLTKDHIFRIPKPYGPGVLFGSSVERLLDQQIGDKPDAFKKFGDSIKGALVPSLTPTAVQPLVEQYSNRSMFTDRTLIPADVEKHLPEYQYTPYTSELAKALGRGIATIPGLRNESLEAGTLGAVTRATTSPILIENYVRAWTGGLGTYLLQGTDWALRKTGQLPDQIKPTPTLADNPFVKAFVARYPSAGAQPIQDFYDTDNKLKVYLDTWKAMAKEGNPAAMQRIQDAGGVQFFARMDGFRTAITQQNQLVKNIYAHPTMPADQKRQLIDTLYYNMIQISRAGNDAMRNASAIIEGASK